MLQHVQCMNSDRKACCFSSGIYQFYPAILATLTWPHLALPPPHITLGAALDNNNLVRLISRCGQGEIIVVIALLHSAVIRDRICLSPDNAAAAAARFRQSWEPRRSISCEMFECEASEVKSVCWKMLCVQYFKNFLQHGPTESTRVKCRQFQCRVIFIYDVKVGGERRSHASLG